MLHRDDVQACAKHNAGGPNTPLPPSSGLLSYATRRCITVKASDVNLVPRKPDDTRIPDRNLTYVADRVWVWSQEQSICTGMYVGSYSYPFGSIGGFQNDQSQELKARFCSHQIFVRETQIGNQMFSPNNPCMFNNVQDCISWQPSRLTTSWAYAALISLCNTTWILWTNSKSVILAGLVPHRFVTAATFPVPNPLGSHVIFLLVHCSDASRHAVQETYGHRHSEPHQLPACQSNLCHTGLQSSQGET